jgi:hypothetical protein
MITACIRDGVVAYDDGAGVGDGGAGARRLTKRWPEDKRRDAFEALHEHYAPILLKVFHTLGGFYIKIGQNGASREDFVPKQVAYFHACVHACACMCNMTHCTLQAC